MEPGKDPQQEQPQILQPLVQEEVQPDDAEKNKLFAILAYIIFFIPLLAARDSKFAMYHANQGLLLLIAGVVLNIVGGIIPFIGPLIIMPLGNLAVFILFIIGVLNAAGGRAKPLPYIGNYQIIK